MARVSVVTNVAWGSVVCVTATPTAAVKAILRLEKMHPQHVGLGPAPVHYAFEDYIVRDDDSNPEVEAEEARVVQFNKMYAPKCRGCTDSGEDS